MASGRSDQRAPLRVLTASLRIGARLLMTGVADAASTQLRLVPAAANLANGGGGHVVRSLQQESPPQLPRGEVGELAFQIALVISQMRQEEFILFLATVVPLTYGLLAFLRYLTGARSDSGEADSDDHHKHHKLELTKLARRHKDATEMITRRMEKDMQELQARLDSVEQGQEARLNELHKDLANTYWQVTKLRSDLSRVTPNSPFKGRCLSSAASAVALSTEAQVRPEAAVPDAGSNEEARLGSSKSAGGAHVWRS
uniref:Uncharacterized protein n=1 Tax=Chrysotila carterae TaxID=13221 RepID=A0A7S4AZH8_CHRCT|mmetsp:Transcript_16680/g.35828  ORF Transcript_16680/g.35828 Transcript_16680/m.35828 type:complete len:257 (+) Transcript_16680:30-800(+)